MKTYEKLFNLLNKNNYISGETLAQELGLSRTSIWKAIQHLEKEGVAIDSIKNKGYRIQEGDLLIPSYIETNSPVEVSYNPKSHSTQLDAKAGIEAGNKGNTLYLAPSQEAAKGRFGRSFYAPSQGGIYMSLHLTPHIPFEKVQVYTMLTAAAIYQAIKNLTLIDVDIKWVNDIYFRQKKIAGIYTEAITSVETGLVTDVIIGVGLNFAIQDFPDDIKDKAGSLFTDLVLTTRNELISEIWKIFYESSEEELIYTYKQRSLVLGKEVHFQQNSKNYSGKAIDISDSGQLLVELSPKKHIWLSSGEISLSAW